MALTATGESRVVAILTLALGIGATTTIFSVVDAVLLRPLPFRDADRIVHIPQLHREDFDLGAGRIVDEIEIQEGRRGPRGPRRC